MTRSVESVLINCRGRTGSRRDDGKQARRAARRRSRDLHIPVRQTLVGRKRGGRWHEAMEKRSASKDRGPSGRRGGKGQGQERGGELIKGGGERIEPGKNGQESGRGEGGRSARESCASGAPKRKERRADGACQASARRSVAVLVTFVRLCCAGLAIKCLGPLEVTCLSPCGGGGGGSACAYVARRHWQRKTRPLACPGANRKSTVSLPCSGRQALGGWFVSAPSGKPQTQRPAASACAAVSVSSSASGLLCGPVTTASTQWSLPDGLCLDAMPAPYRCASPARRLVCRRPRPVPSSRRPRQRLRPLCSASPTINRRGVGGSQRALSPPDFGQRCPAGQRPAAPEGAILGRFWRPAQGVTAPRADAG